MDRNIRLFALPPAAAPILLLLPRAARAERHKHVAAANTHCVLGCLNGGYCSFTKYTDYPKKGDVGFYRSCTCRPGYGGGSCQNVIEECVPPLYQCHNGAPCEVDASGSLGCDCSAADAVGELAGYMCRERPVSSCNTVDEENKSYCANGGVCLSSITASPQHLMFAAPKTHQGCRCADAFEGEHCEYLKGMPASSLAASSMGASAAAKAGIVLLSMFAAIAIIAAVRVARRNIRREHDASWRIGSSFPRFYSTMLTEDNIAARDDADEDDDDDEGAEIELEDQAQLNEEEDLQLMLSSIEEDDYAMQVYEDADSAKIEFV